jgi:acyl carrier protein
VWNENAPIREAIVSDPFDEPTNKSVFHTMTTPTPQEIEGTILSVLGKMNEFLPATERVQYAPDTVLMGDGGTLDSLGIANFIVAMEEAFEDQHHRSVSLSDQDLTDLFGSGSVTVRSFADHLSARMGS